MTLAGTITYFCLRWCWLLCLVTFYLKLTPVLYNYQGMDLTLSTCLNILTYASSSWSSKSVSNFKICLIFVNFIVRMGTIVSIKTMPLATIKKQLNFETQSQKCCVLARIYCLIVLKVKFCSSLFHRVSVSIFFREKKISTFCVTGRKKKN